MHTNQRKTLPFNTIVFVILTFTFAIFMCGCASGKSVYEMFKEIELTDEELELLSEGKLTYDVEYGRSDFGSLKEYLQYRAYQFVTASKGFIHEKALLYIVVSIAIGLIMYLLAPKSIKIRRVAIVVFLLGIPIILLLLFYGSAILADHLK